MASKKLNVLVFASTFPRWAQDPVTARFVLDLSLELQKYFNTYVLTPHTPGAKLREEWEGLTIIRFPYFYPLNSQALVNGTGMLSCLRENRLAAFQIPMFLFCQLRALRKTIADFNIDVVNSHWMIPQGWIASLLKPSLKFKHVLTIHAAGLFALRRLPFGKQMARIIARNSDEIYSVSSYNHHMLNDLIKKTVPARILPMGIHTSFFGAPTAIADILQELNLNAKKNILYVGKLSEKKGVIYLLEAFASVCREFTDVQLIIVGGGLLENSLKLKAQSLGIGDKVRFAGFQDKEMIRKYYHACDMAVIPSIIDSKGETEGLPVVLLEALASGKPVVVTRVGGMPDLIENGVNGFIVEPKDVNAMAEKIKEVLKSETNSFAEHAQKTAQNFDWVQIGKDYRDTFLSLI